MCIACADAVMFLVSNEVLVEHWLNLRCIRLNFILGMCPCKELVLEQEFARSPRMDFLLCEALAPTLKVAEATIRVGSNPSFALCTAHV